MGVVVDLRKNSKTFGQWGSIILPDKLKNILYVTKGFANGSVTLTDDVDLIIKANEYFLPEHGVGINWTGKDLNIDWNLQGNRPFILKRDNNYPSFKEFADKHGGLEI